MDKPFSVVHEEFKQELANLINNSSLPPFIVESVLKNYLYELTGLVKKQYQYDKTQYEKFLLEKEKKEKKNEKV